MNSYILLAKQAVENYIKDSNPPSALPLRRAPGKIISPPKDLPEEFFRRKAGTFVTITKDYNPPTTSSRKRAPGELRGCIGTYLPLRNNIAEEIIHNAVAAATEDYRFGQVREEELPYLSYTVYILSEPELIKDISELDPKKFGIIVKTVPISYPDGTDPFDKLRASVVFNGHFVAKTGLLLPDLEGVDTVEKQVSIACQKGGVDSTKEQILIYKFTVEKYT